MTDIEYRIEHDTMGEVRVPKNALYAAQTQRAVENFPISGDPLEAAQIVALARIKKAAALANKELGTLDAAAIRSRIERDPDLVSRARRLAMVLDSNPAFLKMIGTSGSLRRPETMDDVLGAMDRTFPDALAASNAAAAYREPVLIVPGTSSSLNAATMTTIANRHPAAVAIAGGTGVVSTGIENQLWAKYGKVRLAGLDRYATSLAVNRFAWDLDADASSVFAFVTNGTKFPDALSGAALAGGLAGAPMYTVPPTCVPDAVQQHITALGVYEAYLLGYFSQISFNEPLKRC